MENKPLSNRLAGYAASATAMLALSPAIKAQIIYSGPQNVGLIPGDLVEIDLDGNFTNDFGFFLEEILYTGTIGSYYTSSYFRYAVMFNAGTSLAYNSWMGRYANVYTFDATFNEPRVQGLNSGSYIDHFNSTWFYSTQNLITEAAYLGVTNVIYYFNSFTSFYNYWWAGDFPGRTRYIGIRFGIGPNIHYGWVRLYLHDYLFDMNIIDWAYESQPGVGILAGEGDFTPPVISISGGGVTTNQKTRTLYLTSDEPIYNFVLTDIQVSNGSASNLQVWSPTSYSVDITAANDGTVQVTLPAGAVTDFSLNGNAATSVSWTYDGSGPYLTFSDYYERTSIPLTTLHINSDEAMSPLELTDIQVTNGTAANLIELTPGLSYSVEITASVEGTVQVTIPAGVVEDALTNTNLMGTVSWEYDLTPPVITLSGGGGVTQNISKTLTVSGNEPITGLAMSDIDVVNGAVTDLSHQSGSYSIIVTAASQGIVGVTIPAGSMTDLASHAFDSELKTSWEYDAPDAVEITDLEGVSIYPNPVSEVLHIELPETADISLININGDIVYLRRGVLSEMISVGNFPKGMYILNVLSSDKNRKFKIAVE